MRFTFPISYEMFCSSQPPFVANEPVSRGMFFFLRMTVMVTGVGFVLLVGKFAIFLNHSKDPSANPAKSATIFLMEGLTLLSVWYVRRTSTRNTLREHDDFLRDSYKRLHCRESRFVETTEGGLNFGCVCKNSVVRWPEITSTMESERGFGIATAHGLQIVPASAFSTEADRTQFRTLLSQRLTENKSLSSRAIEFVCTPLDWRNASWLQFKLGGWIGRLGLLAFLCADSMLIFLFAPAFDEGGESVPWWSVALFAFLWVIVFYVSRRKPFRHPGPYKVWFSDDALYCATPFSESRIPWNYVTASLMDKNSLILVRHKSPVVVIPQRFIPAPQKEYILALLRAKLGRGRSAAKGESTHPRDSGSEING